jgi:hypothetical protein
VGSELFEEARGLFEAAGDRRGVAQALEGLAEGALVQQEYERAARYLSAARATRLAAGTPVGPSEETDVRRLVGAVRDALGDNEFARRWWAEWETRDLDIRVAGVQRRRQDETLTPTSSASATSTTPADETL